MGMIPGRRGKTNSWLNQWIMMNGWSAVHWHELMPYLIEFWGEPNWNWLKISAPRWIISESNFAFSLLKIDFELNFEKMMKKYKTKIKSTNKIS